MSLVSFCEFFRLAVDDLEAKIWSARVFNMTFVRQALKKLQSFIKKRQKEQYKFSISHFKMINLGRFLRRKLLNFDMSLGRL